MAVSVSRIDDREIVSDVKCFHRQARPAPGAFAGANDTAGVPHAPPMTEDAQKAGLQVWLEPGGWLIARGLGSEDERVQLRIDPQVAPVLHMPCRTWRDPSQPDAGLQLVHRVPAGLWAGAGAAMRLTLVAAGRPLGPQIEWRRSALPAEIGALVATGEVADALAALDLARQAGLWATLPPGLQHDIAEIAAQQAMTDLVVVSPPGDAFGHDAPPLAPPELTVAARQGAAYDAARCADPSGDPMQVLVSVLGRERADPYFLLSIAADFCLAGQIVALVDLAMTKGIRFPRPGPNNDWLNTAILPFLILSGDEAELTRALYFLAETRKGWSVTPVLGWFGAHLAEHATALHNAPERIRAWMRIVEAQAKDPWGRAPCRVLIAACLRLIAARADLPPDLSAEIGGFALRTHGLSPTFWNAIAAQADPPERLVAGRRAFAALEQEVLSQGDAATRLTAAREGLDWLRKAAVHGIDAFRRETPRLAQPDPGEGGEALLRAYAAPGAGAVPVQDRAAVHDAITASREAVPDTVSNAAALRAACTLAHGLLRGDCNAEGFAAALAELPERRAALLLGVSTLTDLISAGQEGHAAALCEPLAHLAAKAEGETDAGPDLQPALARLSAALSSHPGLGATLEPMLAKLPPVERGEDGNIADPGTEAGASSHMMRMRSSALFDTLVMVRYSPARTKPQALAARESWLLRLADMGVASVIAVSGENTQQRGDVLELALGGGIDARIELTLAMLSWAAEAGFGHVWLVEDDTVLDPEAVFGAYGWRLCDFYGHRQPPAPGFRHPSRGAGQIDLSPGNGFHADAGLGYALSHRALSMLCRIAATAGGARILAGSNNADKAIADLLSLGGIHVEGADHTGALLRPRRPGGLAVPQGGAQGFMPGSASGERAGFPGPCDETRLAPSRLWPATIPARAAPAGRALTLVAGQERLETARAAPVAVICALRNERFILPHFLNHYRRMGVTSFLIADNGSDDGSVEWLAEQPDTVVFSAEAPFREAVQGTEWKIALMAQLRADKWSLVADADEFLVGRDLRGPGHARGWEGGEDLAQFLARPQWRDHDAFRIRMLDLYPDGPLSTATFATDDPFSQASLADKPPFRTNWLDLGPFSDRRALRSALRHRLIPHSPSNMYVSEKVALVRYRPWMRFSVSMHYAAEVRIATQELIFGHFKYTADLEQKVRREVRRGQYYDNAAEYRKYAEMNAGFSAGIADAAASVPWRQSVSDIL